MSTTTALPIPTDFADAKFWSCLFREWVHLYQPYGPCSDSSYQMNVLRLVPERWFRYSISGPVFTQAEWNDFVHSYQLVLERP